jgi:hypothetical protein
MHKTLNTVILFFLGQSVIAQKGIDNLIRAEKDFAAYSVAHSTQEAFLQFIDSNSIMFDEGRLVKATAFWEKREKKPGVLNWYPQFAEISASGDFGFTTGPWTYRASVNDTVIARGQYSTVWQIDKNGQWKFLVDFGIDNKQVNEAQETILDTPKYPDSSSVPTRKDPLILAEVSFNALSLKNTSTAYKTWLSAESILTRNGFLPAYTSTDRKKIIEVTPAKLKYTMWGIGLSSLPDMGYTFGSATINGKPTNYLRIWRRELKGWKIALEVLRY